MDVPAPPRAIAAGQTISADREVAPVPVTLIAGQTCFFDIVGESVDTEDSDLPVDQAGPSYKDGGFPYNFGSRTGGDSLFADVLSPAQLKTLTSGADNRTFGDDAHFVLAQGGAIRWRSAAATTSTVATPTGTTCTAALATMFSVVAWAKTECRAVLAATPSASWPRARPPP